jgi:hypothetical protein
MESAPPESRPTVRTSKFDGKDGKTLTVSQTGKNDKGHRQQRFRVRQAVDAPK